MSSDQPETSGFLSLGDGQIWYEVTGTGHPLVLVHAGWVDRRMWDEQVADFAQHYRVIRYDMRGFGRSTLGSQPYCHANDLAALLKHLDATPAHVVGVSLGGSTALDLALAYPQHVDRLVLVASVAAGTPDPDDPELIAQMQRMGALLASRDRAKILDQFIKLWFDGPVRPASASVRERGYTMLDDYTLAHFDPGAPEGSARVPNAFDEITTSPVPTLVIVGDADQKAVIEATDMLATRLPNARRVVIADAAHMVNLDKPEVFNQHVLGFLADPLATPES